MHTIMATIRLYLDTRRMTKNDTFPLRLAINHKQKTAFINLDIYLKKEQWDERAQMVKDHPNKRFLKTFLSRRVLDVESHILTLSEQGRLRTITAIEIRDYILDKISPKPSNVLFIPYVEEFAKTKTGHTKKNYETLVSKLRKFCDSCDYSFDSLTFDNITYDFLNEFDVYLAGIHKQNTITCYFRYLFTVLNRAYEDGKLENNDYHKIKHRLVRTRKRSLDVDDLRTILNTKGNFGAEVFSLIFYLIGINYKDLHYLKHSDVKNGRVLYDRAKTNRQYSIKIEPEAQSIIDKYQGEDYLLNFYTLKKKYESVNMYVNELLENIEINGDDKVTTYYARHTWATIAHSIGIPKDVISMSLGHSFGVRVTDTYIDFDSDLIDEANRKVIDYVLYDKK